jgi:hypothetical protein
MEPDHNRWAITPPDCEARRLGWAAALVDPHRDERASRLSGIVLASRMKVLVAHVLARS